MIQFCIAYVSDSMEETGVKNSRLSAHNTNCFLTIGPERGAWRHGLVQAV